MHLSVWAPDLKKKKCSQNIQIVSELELATNFDNSISGKADNIFGLAKALIRIY